MKSMFIIKSAFVDEYDSENCSFSVEPFVFDSNKKAYDYIENMVKELVDDLLADFEDEEEREEEKSRITYDDEYAPICYRVNYNGGDQYWEYEVIEVSKWEE